MTESVSTAELEAYLDEALPAEAMAKIEKALRADSNLLERLAAVIGRNDIGIHSLGAIWRRARISCPSRDQLGSYLLGALADELAGYIRFHLETVGCRVCAANIADLQAQQAESPSEAQVRRKRYFQSSAGYLRSPEQ